MANFDYSDLITDNNSIPNGLAAGVMRNSMENKNLLNEKGSLYAGTGTTTAIQDGVGNTYTIPNTEAVPPATGAGQVLMSDDDAPTGMSWQSTVPNATNANNVTTQINGRNISNIFESDGVTVKNAINANNVTTQINGQNISNIFESNGVTVKNATNASQLGGQAANEYALKLDIKTRITSTKKGVYPYEWKTKTWSGFNAIQVGVVIWTDGENIYYSSGTDQYVLNRSTSTWETKTWNGLTRFNGDFIWTDGENIYYSLVGDQYVLNRSTSTWETKTWNGLTRLYKDAIWTDGEDIYYSGGSASQYVLSKVISTTQTVVGQSSIKNDYATQADIAEINARLDSLGFKQGAATISAPFNVTANAIYEQGNYLYGYITTAKSDTAFNIEDEEAIIFTIPAGYRFGSTAAQRLVSGTDETYGAYIEQYGVAYGVMNKVDFGFVGMTFRFFSDGTVRVVTYQDSIGIDSIKSFTITFGYEID